MGIKCNAIINLRNSKKTFLILDPVESLSSILNMYVGTDIKFRCSLYNYAKLYKDPQEVILHIPDNIELPFMDPSVVLNITKVSDTGII